MAHGGMEVRDVPAALVQLSNLITRSLAPELARFSITPQQWYVLVAVADSVDDPSLAAVSRRMMVSKQNMTGMIARLESLGLIRRIEDPADLRASMLKLTRKGQQLVEEVDPVYRGWSRALLANLSVEERKAFARAISMLSGRLSLRDEK
jgi:DNA-binding MarR family transcriptional regulator